MENPAAQEKIPKNFLTYEEFIEQFDDYMHGIAVYEVIDIEKNELVFKDINKEGAKSINYTKEEIIGKNLRELIPNVDEMGIMEAFKRVYKTGNPMYLPTKNYSDDKLVAWYENYVIKLATGELVAFYEDKTREKQLERELNFVIKTANDGYFKWDLKGGEVSFSSKYTQLLGYTKEEFGNTPEAWEKRLHPADKERMLKTITKFLEDKESGDFIETQFRMEKKDGTYVTILSKAAKILGTDGTPSALHGFHIDITTKENYKKELQEKVRELERLNEAMVGRELKMVELKKKLKKAGIDE